MSQGARDHLHMQSLQWRLIVAMSLATLVCGTIGVLEYESQYGHDSSLDGPQSFYHALQMLILHTAHFEHGPNRWILAGEICGAITFFWTGAALFHKRVRRELLLYRMRHWKGHVVVCGLGEKGLDIVKEMVPVLGKPWRARVAYAFARSAADFARVDETIERFLGRLDGYEVDPPRRERMNRVVVIDPDPDESLMLRCEEAGVCVLRGDARRTGVLARAQVAHASDVFSATPSDLTNFAIAAAVSALSESLRNSPRNHVHLADFALREELDARLDLSEGHPVARPHFFNGYDQTARRVLREHPLDGPGIAATDATQVHLVILGFGRMGRSLALHAARLGHFANGKPLRISVVDRNGEIKREPFLAQYPMLANGGICSLEFRAADAVSLETLQNIVAWDAESGARLQVYLCLDDDMGSLMLAMQLQKALPNSSTSRFHVRIRSQFEIAPLLALARHSSAIVDFGAVGDADDSQNSHVGDASLSSKLDEIARSIHDAYVADRLKDPECNPDNDPALRDWWDLRDDLRESNRQQADHLFVKLRAIGCDLVCKDAAGDEVFRLDAPDVALLAPIEHARWNAERWLAGWQLGSPADKQRRISPYLVPWEALDAKIQQYDIDAVKKIPLLVREHLPHLKIVRRVVSPSPIS